MTRHNASIEKALRSRLSELTERVREHESLIRALQTGDLDAVVVLQKDGARISRLHTDEPLYRTIVDSLPQGVVTVLTDGTIVYVNQHLARIIGAPGHALLGSSLLTVVAERDRDRFASILQRALTTSQQATISFQWASGEAPGVVSAIRLPIAGVATVGVAIVDISDQVARESAEAANRAKDELLTAVSHELRAPLTPIMGWIQLLELELADQPMFKDALTSLKSAVIAETKIVDDLLDLSRFEKGAFSLVMKDFDLRETLQTAASFVESQAQHKSLTLAVEIPDAPLSLRGDPDRLRQVFVNLVSNAVKFTARGAVTVRSRAEVGAILIEVIDSGIGITAEFLPQVFEPFRRSESARGFAGLGIGLAISKQLIEAHGGAIEVASDGPNKGSTFTVRLPRS